MATFAKFIKNTDINTLSRYPSGDWLSHRGKSKIFKNFTGWDEGVVFPPGRYGNWSEWYENSGNWQIPSWPKNMEEAE